MSAFHIQWPCKSLKLSCKDLVSGWESLNILRMIMGWSSAGAQWHSVEEKCCQGQAAASKQEPEDNTDWVQLHFLLSCLQTRLNLHPLCPVNFNAFGMSFIFSLTFPIIFIDPSTQSRWELAHLPGVHSEGQNVSGTEGVRKTKGQFQLDFDLLVHFWWLYSFKIPFFSRVSYVTARTMTQTKVSWTQSAAPSSCFVVALTL